MARLAFLGSPEVAVVCLDALLHAGHDMRLVVSGPDRRRGRRAEPSPTPVKRLALERGLEVTDDLRAVVGCGAELGVVVAFGRIVPRQILAALDFVNLHFSLLPRWRGAAPVERALLAGDDATGVSLMKVEAGLDTGPVYAVAETPIGAHETAAELGLRLASLGSDLLVERLAAGSVSLGLPHPQSDDLETTYAPKLVPSELELDWARAAAELERVVRVGRAWTTFRERRLIIWQAFARDPGPSPTLSGSPPGTLVAGDVVTGNGILELVEVQPEGRPRLAATDWLRGAHLDGPERLG